MDGKAKRIYEFGPFLLNTGEHQVLRDNQVVPLTPKAFDLLLVLVENSGRLLEKAELMQRIWPDSFVEEANLSVKMSELRRALGENPQNIQFIETVPRRGYRFVASVKETVENADVTAGQPIGQEYESDLAAAEDAEKNASPSVVLEHRPGPLRRSLPVVAAGLLLLGAAVFLSWNSDLVRNLTGSGDPIRIESIAVLPMDNLSGDPSQDYFADGMTEALITDLAKIGALRVIARPSVIKYKGGQKPLPEIGRELKVDAVLTGSVVRSGDRVRIAVQLTHVATDRNLWAESYERDLRDVLALQNEVTRDIVGQIRIKMTPQEQGHFGSVGPVDPEAYDQYLRGKFYLHSQDRSSNEAAIRALERAVAIDPDFAAGQAELAQAYVWMIFLFTPGDTQLAEKAFVATEKALALDPELAVAHLARGRLLWTPANRFPHEKAIREYRRALELNPNLDEARNQLALVYNHLGAFDEALQELERAVATNPSNSLAQFRIGETLLFQGKYEQALTALRSSPKNANPALVGHQIVWALFYLGRKEEASATIDQFLREYPEVNRSLLTSAQAVIAASTGQERIAEEKIRSAMEAGQGFGHFHHTAYHIACAYALMNKPEQAVKWLRTAADDGFPNYPLFEHDASLNPIRNSPQFVRFMQEMKIQSEGYRQVIAN